MAQPYATGAVAIFVQTTTQGAGPQLLGFGEQAPRLEVDSPYGRIMCDLTGDKIPFDFTFEGALATIGVNLTYWNNAIARRLERQPGPGDGNSAGTVTPGRWRQSDYGAILGLENWTFQLWLRFLFGSGPTAKPIYVSGDGGVAGGLLPQGYRFPNCLFGGPWSWELGTKPATKRQFIFNGWPRVAPADVSSDSIYTLYDNDMSAVANLPIA